MPPAAVNCATVMRRPEARGSEKTRAIYARTRRENQFGVMLGKLRGCVRKLKTNHPLAMERWATGNADAMILAQLRISCFDFTDRQESTPWVAQDLFQD